MPADAFPLRLKDLQRVQQADAALCAKLRTDTDNYSLTTYHGGGKSRTLITHNKKIVVPQPLQRRLVDWYHLQLCHPGLTRTEASIRQHFYWKNLRGTVKSIVTACHTCQVCKKQTRKYGHLPPKEAEVIPWDILCVDLVGPYTIHRKDKEDLILHCVTMIDPATGWFEIKEIPNKRADTIANLVEQTWLVRYPWPQKIIYDRGSEFLAEFATMVQNDYGIRKSPCTSRNPQANSILERVHQTMGNMVRTMEVAEKDLDEDNPWAGLIAATAFALRATYHTTLQATPAQLVFGRDSILSILHQADWALIKERKQRLIDINNARENSKRTEHQYQVGDKILVTQAPKGKYGRNPYKGPYTVVQINTNGTVRYQRGVVRETINLRQIKPYHE